MAASEASLSLRERVGCQPALFRLAGLPVVLGLLLSSTVGAQGGSARARQALGEALFNESEFVNPGADFAPSCNTCHFRGQDPRGSGDRFYSDTSARSLLPGLGGVVRRTTLRNTPMLLELALQKSYGWDGRWSTLEEAVLAELTSDHFGWRPQDRERALDTIQRVSADRSLIDYPELFRRAWFVDVEAIDRQAAVELVVSSLVDYMSEIITEQMSMWDAFGELNRIPLRPSRGEEPKHYAGRIYGRLSNQEGRVLIKRPIGFSEEAYEGFKAFFRVEGEFSVGNCVSCHTPPFFTDFGLHDMGIARREYESLKRSSDGDTEILEGPNGAFRTPMLRNLPRTDPYMHNGAYATLEDVVREYAALSRLVESGDLAGLDEELGVMRLSESDISPIVAFLEALDEVDEAEFRELITDLESGDQ